MHDGGTPVAVQAPRERKLITSAVIPAIVVLVLLSIFFLDGGSTWTYIVSAPAECPDCDCRAWPRPG